MPSPLMLNDLWVVRRLAGDPAWAALEEPGFQAVRTPEPSPVFNQAWGLPTEENLGRASAFFGVLRHRWYLDPGVDARPLDGAGYTPGGEAREMVLDLADAREPRPAAAVQVREAGAGDLEAWCALAGAVFGTGAREEAAVQLPLIRRVGHVPFLALVEGVPAATALVSPGEGTGGVHDVATLPAFRGRGLGAAVTWACVERARAWGLARLALYASPMGAPIYGRLGFRTLGILRERLSPVSPPSPRP